MVRIKVFKIFDGGSNPPSPAVSKLRSPTVQVNFIWASDFFIPGLPKGTRRVAAKIQTKATLR